MQYLNIVLSALGSVVVLFFLTKLMGRRQISQLSMFDYINGITIGSIAAEMATSLEGDFILPLIALIVYAGVAIALSYGNCKSHRLRKFVTGQPTILFDNNKIYEKNFKALKLDLGEFMTECRSNGYFSLSDLQTAIYEPNGRISFLPAEGKRPATPTDLGLTPKQEKPPTALIVDGKVLPENLRQSGKDETWLREQLKSQKLPGIRDIFYAECDSDNRLIAFAKTGKKLHKNIFE